MILMNCKFPDIPQSRTAVYKNERLHGDDAFEKQYSGLETSRTHATKLDRSPRELNFNNLFTL